MVLIERLTGYPEYPERKWNCKVVFPDAGSPSAILATDTHQKKKITEFELLEQNDTDGFKLRAVPSRK